jgi:hypothetical protein
MGITIDKRDYNATKTSYGYYTDENGTMYPFEYNETIEEGEITDFSISWDDDVPDNRSEVEESILDEFADKE